MSEAGRTPAALNAASSAIDLHARVLGNRPLDKEHFMLSFLPPPGMPAPAPGQFFMVEVGGPLEPLLRRPFCYFRRSEDGAVELLYRVRGKGTSILSTAQAGSDIRVLGPLGNHYPIIRGAASPIVVAGGVAIASVYSLVHALKGKAVVVYGAKSGRYLLMADELRAASKELHLATDDGSVGFKGDVLGVLSSMPVGPESVLYICGPRAMTMAVSAYALNKGVRKGYVSLEEFMACGVGACMGCVVATRGGYRRVCREGPVFPITELACETPEGGGQ